VLYNRRDVRLDSQLEGRHDSGRPGSSSAEHVMPRARIMIPEALAADHAAALSIGSILRGRSEDRRDHVDEFFKTTI